MLIMSEFPTGHTGRRSTSQYILSVFLSFFLSFFVSFFLSFFLSLFVCLFVCLFCLLFAFHLLIKRVVELFELCGLLAVETVLRLCASGWTGNVGVPRRFITEKAAGLMGFNPLHSLN